MPVKLSCVTCDKEFYVDLYRIKENAKYCSKQCFQKKWESKYIFNCQNCGKEHIAFGYTEGRKKYCSRSCMEEFRSPTLEKLVKNNYEVKENGCWDWTNSISSKTGYGKLDFKGKTISAHRASYEVFKGEIPKGKHVCHSCDNRKCVNPDHLWVGTQKENIQDMVNKGRKPCQKGIPKSKEHLEKLQIGRLNNWKSREGSKHYLAKLNEEKVKEIKIMIRDGISTVEIAKMFNVCQSNISLIKTGKRWNHVSI
jgi:hypothetical protein